MNELPPPKPRDMPVDEYEESWFGGGICGVLLGIIIILLIAGFIWLFGGGMDQTIISF